MAPLPMPLNDLESLLLIETFLTPIPREIQHHLTKIARSLRGPSVLAELLVRYSRIWRHTLQTAVRDAQRS